MLEAEAVMVPCPSQNDGQKMYVYPIPNQHGSPNKLNFAELV